MLEENAEDRGGGRMEKFLLSNMSSAIDELYYMCEKNSSEACCSQVMKILERAMSQFKQLELKFAASLSSDGEEPPKEERENPPIHSSSEADGPTPPEMSPESAPVGEQEDEVEVEQKAWADYDSEDEIDFSVVPKPISKIKKIEKPEEKTIVEKSEAGGGTTQLQIGAIPQQAQSFISPPFIPNCSTINGQAVGVQPAVFAPQQHPQFLPLSMLVPGALGQVPMVQYLQHPSVAGHYLPFPGKPQAQPQFNNVQSNLVPRSTVNFQPGKISEKQLLSDESKTPPQALVPASKSKPKITDLSGSLVIQEQKLDQQSNTDYQLKSKAPQLDVKPNAKSRVDSKDPTSEDQKLDEQPIVDFKGATSKNDETSELPSEPSTTSHQPTTDSIMESTRSDSTAKSQADTNGNDSIKSQLFTSAQKVTIETSRKSWRRVQNVKSQSVPFAQIVAQQRALKAPAPIANIRAGARGQNILTNREKNNSTLKWETVSRSGKSLKTERKRKANILTTGSQTFSNAIQEESAPVASKRVSASRDVNMIGSTNLNQSKETRKLEQHSVTVDKPGEEESRRLFPRLISSGTYKPKPSSPKKKKVKMTENANAKDTLSGTALPENVAYPALTWQNLKSAGEVTATRISSSPPSNASTRTGSSYRGKTRKLKNKIKRQQTKANTRCSERKASKHRLIPVIRISGFQNEKLNGIYKKQSETKSGRTTYMREGEDLTLWWNCNSSCWLISSQDTLKGDLSVSLASVKDLALDPQFTQGCWRIFQVENQTWVDNPGVTVKNIEPVLYNPGDDNAKMGQKNTQDDVFSHRLTSDIARSVVSEGVLNYRKEQANKIRRTLTKMMNRFESVVDTDRELSTAPPGPFRSKLQILFSKTARIADEIHHSGYVKEPKVLNTPLRGVHKTILTHDYARDTRYNAVLIRLVDNLFQFFPQFSHFSLRSQRSMIQVIYGCVSQNEAVRSHLVKGNLIISLFDVGSELMMQFEQKSEYSSHLGALLSTLTLALNLDTAAEPHLRKVKYILLRYVAVNGFLRGVVKLMHLVTSRCRGILTRLVTTINSLAKLVNVLVTFDSSLRLTPVFDSKSNITEDIVQVMRETNIAGIFALLSHLTLEQYPRKQQWESAWKKRFSLEVSEILTICLNTINEVGRMRLSLLHQMTVYLQLELHHFLSFLLGYISHQMAIRDEREGDSWNQLLNISRELILLIGYCSLDNPDFQDSFRWRGKYQNSLLKTMCDLPIYFFIKPEGKNILIPTLICAVYNQPLSKKLLAKRLNLLHLIKYLSNAIEARSKDSKDRRLKGKNVCDLELRFPPSKWNAAREFFTAV